MKETFQEAWIDDGRRRFIARLTEASACESAITRLIQGIYEREPAGARRILRHRIQATVERPTEMCWGMIRVAAKRIDCGVRAVDHPLAQGCEPIEVTGVEPPPEAWGEVSPLDPGHAPMELARELAAGVHLRETRHLRDRRIAALLLSAEGRLLGWAVNSSATNKTLHAEVNLVQSYCRRMGRLPRGAQIYTTLKSCKMCAGMIWQAAEDPLSIRVYFDQDDPGPKARLTVLSPGSFERKRAAAGTARIEWGPTA